MPGEFQIIRDYFHRDVQGEGLVLGIGDDGAVIRPRPGFDQVVVTDTIVEGRHFPHAFAAEDIGWRALAVNLSDIAAMGAVPRFAFLNLTVSDAVDEWLRAFARGFFALAESTGVVLAGGDTTQGPLSVSVTVIGEAAHDKALRRDGAQVGDLVCVSGSPGEAIAGLEILQAGGDGELVERFRRPEPRLALGAALVDVASAMIDVSDGLVADLAHVMEASGTGARIDMAALPVSPALREYAGERAVDYVLAGGDDYELCFCVPPEHRQRLQNVATDCVVHVIGEVVAGKAVGIVDNDGRQYVSPRRGWEHFSTERNG